MNNRIVYSMAFLGLLMLSLVVPRHINVQAEQSTPLIRGKARVINYQYDAAGRLTQANYGDKAIVYSYDASGNMVQTDVATTTVKAGIYLPLIVK